MGQRIAKFRVEYLSKDDTWQPIYKGTTIGHKVRLIIEDARSTPLISEFGLYYNPDDNRQNLKDYDPKKTREGTLEEQLN